VLELKIDVTVLCAMFVELAMGMQAVDMAPSYFADPAVL